MAFLEDPRLRQRWNQITHDAEAATENAAAGIWSFKQHYINPCFGHIADSIEQCTTVCLGDPEERRRRRRERERAAEHVFDFYDDWYDEEVDDGGSGHGGGGLFGTWGGEDWDRLLAGTGAQRKRGETVEQPRRKRGMSYGTRGTRRKTSENDPTIIPSTQPIGFLSRLPWKMGGTLRYRPSAADLQDHPGKHEEPGNPETEPLLASDDESDYGELIVPRKRSGTSGSGDTSDSFRSRGDLFPSDGEGEEDAVALDDEVTYDMVRNDRSSGRSGRSSKTRSSKGKRPAGRLNSRTVSRTTLASNSSGDSLQLRRTSSSLPLTPDEVNVPSLDDRYMEEQRIRDEEDQEVARKREAALELAASMGMGISPNKPDLYTIPEPKPTIAEDEVYPPDNEAEQVQLSSIDSSATQAKDSKQRETSNAPKQETKLPGSEFVPARLPHFG